MVKKFILVSMCLSSLAIHSSPLLKNAVETLDVDEAVRVLDSEKVSDNELICHIEALRLRLSNAELGNLVKLCLGMIGGTFAGIAIGQLCWKKYTQPNAYELLDPKAGVDYRAGGATVGMILGTVASVYFFRTAERNKARIILHLLTNKLGEKMTFVQPL